MITRLSVIYDIKMSMASEQAECFTTSAWLSKLFCDVVNTADGVAMLPDLGENWC